MLMGLRNLPLISVGPVWSSPWEMPSIFQQLLEVKIDAQALSFHISQRFQSGAGVGSAASSAPAGT